jgi:hypothetical protein
MAKRNMVPIFTARNISSNFGEPSAEHSQESKSRFTTPEEDDKVVARWTMTMTHTGPFLGLQPTHKRVSVNGMSIQRFKNGQMVSGWDNWDQLGLMVQLGAVPEPKFL